MTDEEGDGGTKVTCGCGDFSIMVSDIAPIHQFGALCPECGNPFGWDTS